VIPLLIFSILIIAIDRISKALVFNYIDNGLSLPIIRNILHISPIANRGIAFGLLKKVPSLVFISISLFTVIFIGYIIFFKRPKSKLFLCGLFLIASGAISNLIDRILYGYVMDFIDIRVWPVFNIADSSITVGGFLLFFYFISVPAKKYS
jgi:signal peptidase II